MSNTIIDLAGVNLTLQSAAGPVTILRGIDLAIAEGEAVGLVGPSGSGKSTLLMIVAGLEIPTAGDVIVAGRDLSRLGEDARARFRRDHVGIVFQSFHLMPTMNALENVAIPLELAGVRDAFRQARMVLERVGLGHRLRHFPAQLSGGEQQRVALARAVIARPKILLADEPTGNLDAANGDQIMALLFELHARSATTLLLITHEPELAARCDRVVRLRDGRIEAVEAGIRRRKAVP